MKTNWSPQEPVYRGCFPIAELIMRLELVYPPVDDESLETEVLAYRNRLYDGGPVGAASEPNRRMDTLNILYLNDDSAGIVRFRAAGRNVHVEFSRGLRDRAPGDYDVLVADGAVSLKDTGLLRRYVRQGGGVVLAGRTPFDLAGGDQYLGPIADWFGAVVLLTTWGSGVSMVDGGVTDMVIGPNTTLPGQPSWRAPEWAVLPFGPSREVTVVGWYGFDIAAFCVALQPDSAYSGRVFYQARVGDSRSPQLDSLYASGIRWAARRWDS
jgi:hypothetical protein